MPPEATSADHDDPRLMQVAREFLAELEAGRVPDRRPYLARFPDLAVELDQCLDGIELAHGAGRAMEPQPVVPDFAAGTLGDYQIVREIGRGGMGVVYEAVQLSLRRPVALKVLPFAAGLDARQLQRFKTEAHAAAGLHHTNIVPVHAVGCERGVHFYAMQLIDGRPLDAVIQELRGDPAARSSTGGTTTEFRAAPATPASVTVRTVQRSGRDRERYRTAARIAAQVADALEYAHSAGVIHRDIKPANLLLDGRGTVWVTDFGLAHVSDVGLTQTGDVVGTLRYMSPEQAAGRRVLVDHRADIYSLGATLYELLTLRPIFEAADRGALLNQILNEEPRPLRLLDRSIPVELETIVLKAVAKAPEDRYASGAELAADLRRFLDERPILARRPSLAERLRKWLRRHPSFVAAALLLLTFSTVVLGVAVALVGREHARTETAYAAERQRAREAEVRFQLAERAVDDLVLVAQEELRDRPDAENLRKQLMEMALAYHQEFIELHRDDPGAQARLAENRARVEALLTDLIDKEAARRADLLKDWAVLDDLRLRRAEREAIDQLNDRLKQMREAAFREFHRLPSDERDRRFLEMARAIDAAVGEVLTAEQVRRLKQIELQRHGPEAFRRPDVVAALKLTTQQRARVRTLITEPFGGKGEPPGPPDRRRKAAVEKIVAQLTPEQSARWQEMIGEPYKGPLPKSGRPKGPPFR